MAGFWIILILTVDGTGLRIKEEAMPTVKAREKSKKLRSIAFVLASIHSGSAIKVWPELVKESERHSCSLFIFPGGRLESPDENEYMRNAIFPLAGCPNFDGILSWASSLSGFVPESDVEAFHRGISPAPLVTFGMKAGDHPAVCIDAYSGMKRLVRHLARTHSCKRIAYLGGPREHSSAEHRYAAYRDALAECGLTFDERLASLDNPWTDGRKALSRLLDERGLAPGRDFDALCGASDLLIFEAAGLLRERDIKIPADIALGGFNDSDESHLFSPTYTTVHMPFDRQALNAFRMLLDLMDGRNPPDRLLKTRLVIRQSCGCLPESVRRAGEKVPGGPSGQGAKARVPAAEELADIMAKAMEGEPELGKERFLPAARAFLDCLSGKPSRPFIEALDLLVGEAVFTGRDIDAFQDMLSAIRSACAPSGPDPAFRNRLESCVGQGRVLVSDAGKRMSNFRSWKEKSVDQTLGVFNHELLCAKDTPSIVAIAGRFLPAVGIHTGFLVLEDHAKKKRAFVGGFRPANLPGGGTRLIVPRGGKTLFSRDLLLPGEYLPSSPGAFIVLPLYYESTSLGYLALSAGGAEASIFEEVRSQISGAIRGVLLFERANEARRLSERAEKLKTGFIAGISEDMQEPLAAINSLARRLLESAPVAGRKEIEAIAAHSSRQLELTRRLLDLSLAQVDELPLERKLFNPRAFMLSLLEELEAGREKAGWGRILREDFPALLPFARGDRARIAQVFGIFLDCIFREPGAGEAVISVRPLPGGIRFSARGRKGESPRTAGFPDAGLAPKGEAGGARPDPAFIEMELARKIAFLQGGKIDFTFRDRLAEFFFTLPYPSIDNVPRDTVPRPDAPDCPAPLVLGGSDEMAGKLSRIFPGASIRRAALADVAAGSPDPGGPSLIFLDPEGLDPSGAALLACVLADERFRKHCWFITAKDDSPEPACPGVFEYLDNLGRSVDRGDILLLGREDAAAGPAAQAAAQTAFGIAAAFPDRNRIIQCRTAEELDSVARNRKPAVLVIAGEDLPFLDAVASKPELADLPLVCAAPSFSDEKFASKAADRPSTLLFNSGETFGAALSSRIHDLPGGAGLLPPATGAIITKAVFFLNRHFRDPISRWKLSERLNVSEDYLSRIFRRQTGLPLWEYLNRLRIAYAIDLLRTTGESVAEIAYSAGFQDQAYFCRVFRRIAGATPGTIRKSSSANVRKIQ